MDWKAHYPAHTFDHNAHAPTEQKQVEVADIGCGYGGLLFALGPQMPESLLLGKCHTVAHRDVD